MSDLAEVTIIVPTRAHPARGEALARALRSIHAQERVSPQVVLVINGGATTIPGPARDELDRLPHVTVCLEEANLPAAYRAGRREVRTPWFGSLDDDDELLPGSLRARVDALAAQPGAAVVVSNGLCRSPAGDRLLVSDPDSVNADPFRRLLAGNWLLPGSWLCRTEVVGEELFAGMPPFLECTYLGLRFAALPGFSFLPAPGVAWTVGEEGQSSRSIAHSAGQPDALATLAALDLPGEVSAELRRRIPGACQDAAERMLEERQVTRALGLQVRALRAAPAAEWPALGQRILSSWRHGGRA